MFISDNGASAEGGPTGSVNENKFFNNVPDSLEENLAEDRRARRADDVQSLRLGLDARRQHALPPLEARDLSRRRQRPVPRALAERDQGEGTGPDAVRARHRHGADRARGAGPRSPDEHQGRHAVADRGAQLRARLRRCEGAVEARDAVLRDVRAPVDLSRRLARGLPVARHVVRRVGSRVRRADRRDEAHRAGREGLGAVPHREGLRRERTTWRRRSARS